MNLHSAHFQSSMALYSGNQFFISLSGPINIAKQFHLYGKATRMEYDTERLEFDKATLKGGIGLLPIGYSLKRGSA